MKQLIKKISIIIIIAILQFIIYFITGKVNADAEQVGSWDISGDSNSNVTATVYNNGSLVISGTGKIKNCSSDNLLIDVAYRDNIKDIKIEDGVTSIGYNAFESFRGLESISISNTVKEIGDQTFLGCESLMAINIPSGVEKIGINSFSSCNSLNTVSIELENKNFILEKGILYNKEKTRIIICSRDSQEENYEIPSTVRDIDRDAFMNCSEIKGVTLPEGIEKINVGIFYKCLSLQSVNIPNSVKSIEDCAFWQCNSLEEINIPANVEKIGVAVFYQCYSLNSVDVDSNNNNYIMDNGILYNKEKTRIIRCSKDKQQENYTLPSTVVDIDSFAFTNCSIIKSITLPEKIKVLNYGLFYCCTSLQSINISNSVYAILNNAFSSCRKLENITIPDSVTKIGKKAFSNCDSLKSINISKNVNEIGEGAISHCNNLSRIILDQNNNNFIMENGILYNKEKTRIIICSRDEQPENYEIPSTVRTIDDTAFFYCDNIKSINISENVEKIGDASFGYCENLTSISLNPSNSNFIIEDGILYNKDKTKAIICIREQQKESYDLPSTVETIDQSAFLGCDRIKNIKLPEKLNNIGTAMFWYCSSLENIIIPEKVKLIYNSEFYENNNIIYVNPFRECINLKNINVDENNEDFSSEDGILYNKEKTKLLVYPQGKTEEVFITPYNIEEIGDIAFSENTKLEKLIILENVQNIGAEIFNENDVTTIYCKENTTIENFSRENNLRYEIDEEAPEIISVEGNTQNRVEDKVILTINAQDNKSGLAENAYSFDNGQTWQESNTKEYTENISGIIIKVRDNIGNVREYDNEINITNTKKIKNVTIKQMPEKVEYKKGEKIDLDGLILEIEYDDGTKEEVTEGYTTNVTTLNEIGDKEVRVSYEDKEVILKIRVIEQDGEKQDGEKQDGEKQDGEKQDREEQDGNNPEEDTQNKANSESNSKQDTVIGKEDSDTANDNIKAKNTITNLSNSKLPYTGLIGKLMPIGIIITLSVAIMTCIGYIKYKNLK